MPDPTLEVDEEIVDERDATDNGGMPFINPEGKMLKICVSCLCYRRVFLFSVEPTKGLFRSPPDGLVLPECRWRSDYILLCQGL